MARLCGVKLIGDKKFDAGSTIAGAVLTLVTVSLTYYLYREGSWWGFLPGSFALLFFIATVTPSSVAPNPSEGEQVEAMSSDQHGPAVPPGGIPTITSASGDSKPQSLAVAHDGAPSGSAPPV